MRNNYVGKLQTLILPGCKHTHADTCTHIHATVTLAHSGCSTGYGNQGEPCRPISEGSMLQIDVTALPTVEI